MRLGKRSQGWCCTIEKSLPGVRINVTGCWIDLVNCIRDVTRSERRRGTRHKKKVRTHAFFECCNQTKALVKHVRHHQTLWKQLLIIYAATFRKVIFFFFWITFTFPTHCIFLGESNISAAVKWNFPSLSLSLFCLALFTASLVPLSSWV